MKVKTVITRTSAPERRAYPPHTRMQAPQFSRLEVKMEENVLGARTNGPAMMQALLSGRVLCWGQGGARVAGG